MSVTPEPVVSAALRRWAVCFVAEGGSLGPISYILPGQTPEAAAESLRRFYLSNLSKSARLRAKLGIDEPTVETAQVSLVGGARSVLILFGLEKMLTFPRVSLGRRLHSYY